MPLARLDAPAEAPARPPVRLRRVVSDAGSASRRPGRMLYPDALRGLAALAVILPHSGGFFIALAPVSALAEILVRSGPWGARGVDVFFAISGFVIAANLTGEPLGFRRVAQFISLRTIRLTPPYWAGILLACGFLALRAHLGSHAIDLPDASAVLWNALYLQKLVGAREINVVFWTLAIELQFYGVFAIFLALCQRLGRVGRIRPSWALGLPALLLFTLSVQVSQQAAPGAWSAWLLPYGFQFLLGSLAWWTLRGPLPAASWWVAGLVLGVFTILFPGAPIARLWIPFLTGLSFFAFGRWDWLERHPRSPALAAMGRISYSLYLVHVPILAVFLGLQVRLENRGAGLPGGILSPLGIFLAAVLTCLVAAWAFNRWIEMPSIALARELGRRWRKP